MQNKETQHVKQMASSTTDEQNASSRLLIQFTSRVDVTTTCKSVCRPKSIPYFLLNSLRILLQL